MFLLTLQYIASSYPNLTCIPLGGILDSEPILYEEAKKPKKKRVVPCREKPAPPGLDVALRRVEGQVRGVQKMVEEDRYCPDVLVQMSAIHESLRAVERILMKDHLQHCATEALRSGDDKQAQRTYNELTELFYRHAR